MNTDVQFRIETESKNIIDTGSVIQFHNEDIIFLVDDLRFRFRFISDGWHSRITTNIADDESEMIVCFYNYDNNLGVGNTEPLVLATLDEKKLFLMIRVNTLSNVKKFRLINYTWYLEK